MRCRSKQHGDTQTWVCLVDTIISLDTSHGLEGTKCLLAKALRKSGSELLHSVFLPAQALPFVAAGAHEESPSLWYVELLLIDAREGETVQGMRPVL